MSILAVTLARAAIFGDCILKRCKRRVPVSSYRQRNFKMPTLVALRLFSVKQWAIFVTSPIAGSIEYSASHLK